MRAALKVLFEVMVLYSVDVSEFVPASAMVTEVIQDGEARTEHTCHSAFPYFMKHVHKPTVHAFCSTPKHTDPLPWWP
jgi:hypothetical protein